MQGGEKKAYTPKQMGMLAFIGAGLVWMVLDTTIAHGYTTTAPYFACKSPQDVMEVRGAGMFGNWIRMGALAEKKGCIVGSSETRVVVSLIQSPFAVHKRVQIHGERWYIDTRYLQRK